MVFFGSLRFGLIVGYYGDRAFFYERSGVSCAEPPFSNNLLFNFLGVQVTHLLTSSNLASKLK